MPLRTIIVTGLSGAGKSTALKSFEDMGFYCVDNLPVFLLADLLRGCAARPDGPQRLALGMDVRDPAFVASFEEPLDSLRAAGFAIEILFLDAQDEVLVRRYSQMRRLHPFAGSSDSVQDGIERERLKLAELKERADHVFDTSEATPHALRRRLIERFGDDSDRLRVNVVSFGFKNGLPIEADLLFDVRFLPNPHYVPELKPLTGLNQEVAAYALENSVARQFFGHLRKLLSFLIPEYRREGKVYLTIAIGCTGGKHRSVAVAEQVGAMLVADGETVMLTHRDLTKE